MKNDNYTQCKLRKGNTYQMSWIPSQFAKVGKMVEASYSTRKWEEFNENSQAHKHQRKASDI